MKERYMKDLLDIRKDIDKIDEQIVKLYEERMKLTSDVAEYKINTGKQIFDKEREESKLATLQKKRKVILPDTESVNFLSRSWR